MKLAEYCKAAKELGLTGSSRLPQPRLEEALALVEVYNGDLQATDNWPQPSSAPARSGSGGINGAAPARTGSRSRGWSRRESWPGTGSRPSQCPRPSQSVASCRTPPGSSYHRLARTLKSPAACHPVWFKEAEIAVRHVGLGLGELDLEAIRAAILSWRAERKEG